MNKYFTANGIDFSKLWHCFGNSYHLASLDSIKGLLRASQTNVLPINTHRLNKETARKGLELGYAGITLDFFEQNYDTSDLHKMLNINLQTTANEAVDKTKLAFDLTGERIVKLEVLDKTHKDSNQNEIIKAAEALKNWNSSLMILPLFYNEVKVARSLIDLGCPILRVMGSSIGQRKGIVDTDSLKEICSMGVPVILDGGIGSIDHALEAMNCGATGVLINSMLFEFKEGPVEVMKNFATKFYEYLEQQS